VGPTHRVDADSDSREYIPTADSPFYCYFPDPPRSACRFTCVSAVPVSVNTGVCVLVPCGIFRGTCPSGWSRVRSDADSVARVCQLTTLCTRTTLCLLSLLRHWRRWVSLTYHDRLRLPPPDLRHDLPIDPRQETFEIAPNRRMRNLPRIQKGMSGRARSHDAFGPRLPDTHLYSHTNHDTK
jgi:hypothetical protein